MSCNRRYILTVLLLLMHVGLGARALQIIPTVPPPPQITEEAPPPPAVAESVIEVPVSVSIGDTLEQIEALVPDELDASRKWLRDGGKGIKFRYWRGPFKADLTRDILWVEGEAYHWLKTAKGFSHPPLISWITKLFTTRSCGSNKRPHQSTVEVASVFNPDGWSLKHTTRFQLQNSTPCSLTFRQRLAFDKIAEALQPSLSKASDLIDSKLDEINFRPHGERAWEALTAPVELGVGGAWLTIKPEKVRILNVGGSGQSLTATLGIVATTKTHQARPERVMPAFPALPSASTAGDFHLVMENQVSLEDASNDLEAKMVGRQFSADGNLAQLTAIVITAQNESVVMKVRFTGSIRGTIYVQGKLVTDPSANKISAAELNFSEPTRSTLESISASWLQQTPLLQELAAAATWVLDEQLKTTGKTLEQSLNRSLGDNAVLRVTFSRHEITNGYAGSGAFRIPIISHGSAWLTLR